MKIGMSPIRTAEAICSASRILRWAAVVLLVPTVPLVVPGMIVLMLAIVLRREGDDFYNFAKRGAVK